MPSDSGQRGGTASPADEEILAAVRALQAGAGSEAFGPIARGLTRPLTTFFAKRVKVRDQADDLVQLTLIRVYEKIGQYRFEAPFSAWVATIAGNIWFNECRHWNAAKRGAPVESLSSRTDEGREGDESRALADPGPSPEAEALAAEQQKVVRLAIESLPRGMRIVAELQLIVGLKYREISEITGISLDAVRSQLFEARKRLKPLLEQYFQGLDL